MHEKRDWESLLQRYTESYLTYETDRLIALQGIANKLKKTRTGTYSFGTWTDDLPKLLFWIRRQISVKPKGPKNIPSWSWASRSGSMLFWKTEYQFFLHQITATEGGVDIREDGSLKVCAPVQQIRVSPFPAEGRIQKFFKSDCGFSPESTLLKWRDRLPIHYIHSSHSGTGAAVGLAAFDEDFDGVPENVYAVTLLTTTRLSMDPLWSEDPDCKFDVDNDILIGVPDWRDETKDQPLSVLVRVVEQGPNGPSISYRPLEKHNLSLPQMGQDRDERQSDPGRGSERAVEVEDNDEVGGSEGSELQAQEVVVDGEGKGVDESSERREDDSLRMYDVEIEPEEQQENSHESRDREESKGDCAGKDELESLKRKASDYLRKHDGTDIIPEEQEEAGEEGELDSSFKINLDSSSHECNNAEFEPEQLQQEDVKYIDDVEEENHNREEYDHEAEMEAETDTLLSLHYQYLRDLPPPIPYAANGAYVHWVLLLEPVEEQEQVQETDGACRRFRRVGMGIVGCERRIEAGENVEMVIV
jgi:hypothetical protein